MSVAVGPLCCVWPTASVAVAVALVTTRGVAVAVATCGVIPAGDVWVATPGPPGAAVSCASAVPVAKDSTGPIASVGPGEANKLCETGVDVATGACEYARVQPDVMIMTSISVE